MVLNPSSQSLPLPPLGLEKGRVADPVPAEAVGAALVPPTVGGGADKQNEGSRRKTGWTRKTGRSQDTAGARVPCVGWGWGCQGCRDTLGAGTRDLELSWAQRAARATKTDQG